MQDQHSRRRVPVGIVTGFSVLIVATGSAVALWSWTSTRNPSSAPQPAQQKSQPSESSQAGQLIPPGTSPDAAAQKPQPKSVPTPNEAALQVYWLKGSGSDIALAAAPVKFSSTARAEAPLKAALEQLLAGPSNSTFTTTIPKNTQLNSLAVRQDGIHVDLSRSFTQGGGSASMTARVAQVLYTATSLNPNAQVWLSIDGKPLQTLGGEGLILDQPLTRKQFNQDFSL